MKSKKNFSLGDSSIHDAFRDFSKFKPDSSGCEVLGAPFPLNLTISGPRKKTRGPLIAAVSSKPAHGRVLPIRSRGARAIAS
ncbi:MAG: hypothetical protein WA705_07610, partial [Candidatus Ozemobacteraceae bacterium]